jgi:NitT/TauT family transport system permease protein/putative hydroxymethylpyrimidine transport system permease protein
VSPERRRRLPGGGRLLLPALVIAGLIGLWQLAASTGAIADALNIKPFLVPSPAEVADSLWQNRSLLAENAWVTLREIVIGFAIALLAGLAFAVLLHLFETLRRAFYPLVVASQTIPIVVVAPILVVWFGFGNGPTLAVIALICFFPITVNTLDGLATVPVEQRRLMRSLGASRLRLLTLVEGPTALPFALSGAKVAAAVAVIGAVFGEWAGANDGLGHLMLVDNAQLEVARLFAAIVWLSAIAIALFACLGLIGRRIAWWGEPAETGGKPGEE